MDYIKMPKIDLHCHLDGSVRPETLLELAIKKGVKPRSTLLEEIQGESWVTEDCQSLVEYLHRFRLPQLVMQEREALFQIAGEFMADCQKDGLSYVEVRFAPVFHTLESLSFEEVMDAVLEGLHQGSRKTGIPFGLIVCCMRHLSAEASYDHVKQTLPYVGQGVVAVDLAGDEAHYPPRLHEKAFDLARSHDLGITVHAGETGIDSHISDAITYLYANRIGHGTAAWKNPDLMQVLKERQITLEMCPTSNVHTKSIPALKDHPAKRYLDQGLAVTLNTDNRTVSNITLSQELAGVTSALMLSDADLKAIYSNAVKGAFCPSALKTQLMSKWK
jgi:adenosine deaminase